ncbi:MAG: hypothetical protein ABMA13_00710 [Chthoniobacteraceae bacterium]
MSTLHTHITGSFQSASKVAFLLLIGVQSHAADLFSQSGKDKAAEDPRFSTVAALLDATRSGDVPGSLNSSDPATGNRYQRGVGASVLAILQKQNLLPKTSVRHDTASMIGLMFVNISQYELSGHKDEHAPQSFRNNWKLFCELHRADENPQFRDQLDLIFKEYSQAVQESLILKKERDDQRMAESAVQQREADLSVQRMSETAAQKKAVVDAQAASKRAEDDARALAVQGAMQAQAEVRKKKLEAMLASPAYKLWRASLQVEEGIRLITKGRSELAAQTAVERESGVVDLAARRAAGERVYAGKRLVEQAFESYLQLGGEAATPEEVKAGADPAAEYR